MEFGRLRDNYSNHGNLKSLGLLTCCGLLFWLIRMVPEKGARAGAMQRVSQRQNPHHCPTPVSGSGFLIFAGAHGRQMLEPPRRSSEEALHQMGLEPQDAAQPAP